MVYIYLMLPMIINIAFTIWVFIDAQNHDSDYALLWALATFWFGPFAFAVWLFVRNRDFDAPLISCPSCREYYTGDPFLCPHCAYPLKEGIVDMSAQYPEFEDTGQEEKK